MDGDPAFCGTSGRGSRDRFGDREENWICLFNTRVGAGIWLYRCRWSPTKMGTHSVSHYHGSPFKSNTPSKGACSFTSKSMAPFRSEERRVGKEGTLQWAAVVRK